MRSGIVKILRRIGRGGFPACFVLGVFVLFCPKIILAAKIDISPVAEQLTAGEWQRFDVFLDTEGEDVNAIEGKLSFLPGILEVKEIRDGDSLITFWVERPALPRQGGEVAFSGIVPGGFSGEKGKLFSFAIEAKNEGFSPVKIEDLKLFKNDGMGTEIGAVSGGAEIRVSPRFPGTGFAAPFPADTTVPEEFRPTIQSDVLIYEGKRFIIFTAQDKQSGIDYFEVAEKRGLKQDDYKSLEWFSAQSPYLLKDQDLKSYVYVKAVDRAGNERVEIVFPKNPPKWYEDLIFWAAAVLAVAAIAAMLWDIRRRKNGEEGAK